MVSYRKAADLVLYEQIPDDDPAKEALEDVLAQADDA